MKLSDFILLNEEEKNRPYSTRASSSAKEHCLPRLFFLFQVQNFYVEACFNPASKDIEEFRMFDHTRLLDPYLDSISLDGLLN